MMRFLVFIIINCLGLYSYAQVAPTVAFNAQEQQIIHQMNEASKRPALLFVGQMISEVNIGMIDVDVNGPARPAIEVEGQILSDFIDRWTTNEGAFEDWLSVSRKSPESRTTASILGAFKYQSAGNDRWKLEIIPFRYRGNQDGYGEGVPMIFENIVFNYSEISIFVFTFTRLNPQIKENDLFVFKVNLGKRVNLNHKGNWISVEAEPSVGFSWSSYNIDLIKDHQQVPAVIQSFQNPDDTGGVARIRAGIKTKIILPLHLEFTARTGYFYQSSYGANPDEQRAEQKLYDAGELSDVTVKMQQRMIEFHAEINRPIGPHRKLVGVFFDGQFFRKLTAEGSFLNRRFDLTPLAPPVPFQVGVKARF